MTNLAAATIVNAQDWLVQFYSFPLNPVPSKFKNTSAPKANGIFYPGDTVTFTLAGAGATGYVVRDYYGTIVSSGSLTGSTTTCTPTAPGGGWKYGWYRLYLTGPLADLMFGSSYGAFTFVVVPTSAAFPTAPNWGAVASVGGGANYADLVAHGTMGIGPVRYTISNCTAPTTGEFTISTALASVAQDQSWWLAYGETARPREALLQIPNGGFDTLRLSDSGTGYTIVQIYCATTALDGSLLTVAKSGTTVTVVYNGSTVHTFTGITTGQSLITAAAGSSYIKVFNSAGNAALSLADFAATAIGRAYWNGVVQVVTACYPSIPWYEGPVNEPQGTLAAEVAWQMAIFTAAVKVGNASAKTAGPSVATINNQTRGWIDDYCAAGGGNNSDAFSFHPYNAIINDLAVGRRMLSTFQATLARYGLGSKPLWQTENGTVFIPVYGAHHPRRAYWYMLQTLLFEQFGVTRERNILFNDASHGFWGFPTWMVNSDSSLNSHAPMIRQLTVETRGMTYTSRFNFGTLGDTCYLGSLYSHTSNGTKTAVFQAAGPQLNGQVVLTVTGANTLTVADCFGNTSTVSVAGGRAIVPVQETPVYVRLPNGVAATLYSFSDWPPLAGVPATANLNSRYQPIVTVSDSAQPKPSIADTVWQSYYAQGFNEDTYASTALPFTATISLFRTVTIDRVLIHSMCWQGGGTPLDFDVQTTSNGGTSWTTRATVTRPTPSAFIHGAGGAAGTGGTGTQYETFWDEMRIFDVKLPARYAANGVRLLVRSASYGGEPDSATGQRGQGYQIPRVDIQQITPLCDDIAVPRYVTVS